LALACGNARGEKSEEWGVAKMKAIGLENVHKKNTNFGADGRAARPRGIAGADSRPLHVDAMADGIDADWGAEGEVVPVNLFEIDEEVKNTSRLSGKIVMVVMHGEPKKSGDILFCHLRKSS